MKNGGNVENNITTGQNSKKRDFENIKFRKIVKKSDRKEDFNYLNFMERHKLKSVTDELMVIDEFYRLVG